VEDGIDGFPKFARVSLIQCNEVRVVEFFGSQERLVIEVCGSAKKTEVER